MLFNSAEYLFFLPLVVLLYFNVSHRDRWMVLLGSSYFFYMNWRIAYIGLIIASTLLDFHAAQGIDRATTQRARKAWLAASLAGNLGLLCVFKYYNFLVDSLNAALALGGADLRMPQSSLLLPVGISFYTFQTLAYTIDVYRGRLKAEKRPGVVALYVAFFPQLVAGPIERAQSLMPQFDIRSRFDPGRAVSGLQQILWGFFKKMIIADNLATAVDIVYATPGAFAGPSLVFATVLFAFQIFCDFSGYSDIACGSARVLGFDLMKNFDRPYSSRSVAEFWRRWHISLSTWFRDYVYIPLGGNRGTAQRRMFNVFVVFAASGLWHGANWTFLIWGCLHFVFFAVSDLTLKTRSRLSALTGLAKTPLLHGAMQTAWTFALVCFAWVFFRAQSLVDAWLVVTGLTTGWTEAAAWTSFRDHLLLTAPFEITAGVFGILVMETYHWLESSGDVFERLARKPTALRWATYYALTASILLMGSFGERQFLYFQF
jgi:D-alanyl-lipoteichoic acid acyltransferase DltB (MBOAT superfamily)